MRPPRLMFLGRQFCRLAIQKIPRLERKKVDKINELNERQKD